MLNHPLRRRLLLEYTHATTSPSAIAGELGEPLNSVAYHTGVLAERGFIELVGTERRRGALTHFYRAAIGPVVDFAGWEALPEATRRALVLGTLEQIHVEAQRAALDSGFDHRDAALTRLPLVLDEIGLRAIGDLLRRVIAQMDQILGEVAPREALTEPYEIVVMAYERADSA